MRLFLKKLTIPNVFAVIILVCGLIAAYFWNKEEQPKDVFLRNSASIIQNYLKTSVNTVQKATNKLEQKHLADFDFEQCTQATNLLNINIPVFIYKNDSLVFWNSNQIRTEIPDIFFYKPTGELSNAAKPIFNYAQNNGLSVLQCIYRLPTSGYLVVASVPIQHQKSSSQQQYFKNALAVSLPNSDIIRLTDTTVSGGLGIFSPNNEPLFKIKLTQNNIQFVVIDTYKKYKGYAILSLFLAFFVRIILYDQDFKALIRRNGLRFWFFTFVVLLARVGLFIFKKEIGIDGEVNELFSANIFANSDFTPSLGDLFLHTLALMFICLYGYKQRLFFEYLTHKASKIQYYLPVFFHILLTNFILYLVLTLAHDSVINSNIPFGAGDFLNLTIYSTVVYSIFMILGGVAIYQLRVLIAMLRKYKIAKFIFAFQVAMVVATLLPNFRYLNVIAILIFFIVASAYWVGVVLKNRQISTILVTFFIVMSIAITLQTSLALYQKQIERAKFIAENIKNPDDKDIEQQFTEIGKQIQVDTALTRSLERGQIEFLKGEIINKYFSSVLKTYNFDSVYIQKSSINSSYFKEINPIKFQGRVRTWSGIAKISHWLSVPFVGTQNTIDTLFFKISQSSFGEQLESERGFSFDYSVGIYKNQRLILRKGSYQYNLNNAYFRRFTQDFGVQNDGFDVHLSHFVKMKSDIKVSQKDKFFKPKDIYHIVISFKNPLVYDFPVGASSLLLAFLFAYFVFYLAYELYQNKFFWRDINYRSKIALVLTTSVLFSQLLFGYITIFYTFNKSKELQSNNLLQKTYKGSIENVRNANLQNAIFYSTKGILSPNNFSNSQVPIPLSQYINARAYYDIAYLGKSVLLQTEHFGSLGYLACYAPILDENKNIVGIVNFPDFFAWDELRATQSGFLSTLLNIYVLMLLLMLVLVLWVSNRVTAPLGLITRVIANTHLKEKLPKLDEINRRDEIGDMIREYYKKMEEVELSAEMIARSEKDLAWREMARQIAHEVRNPLTPIQLSIQHLRRAYREQSDNFPAMFERVCTTILEQTQSLNNIASEFSSFAKIGALKVHSPINIHEICVSAINLYADMAQLRYKNQLNNPDAMVSGDEEQISRVLNNLLKNATQSRPNTEEVVINVFLFKHENMYVIQINDNGNGIPLDIQPKIFEPNFTTKTSGMGLGLAIVRRIVEQHNGSIRFDSTLQGTSFFVELPISE